MYMPLYPALDTMSSGFQMNLIEYLCVVATLYGRFGMDSMKIPKVVIVYFKNKCLIKSCLEESFVSTVI